jgi:hypothetical protein
LLVVVAVLPINLLLQVVGVLVVIAQTKLVKHLVVAGLLKRHIQQQQH